MDRTLAVCAAAALLALVGCDEDKKASAPRSDGDSQAPFVAVFEPARITKAEAPSAPAAAEASGAASPAPDQGRIVFDGDRARGDVADPAGPVYAGAAPSGKKPAAYTAAARPNTLSVKDPPPPAWRSAAEAKSKSVLSTLAAAFRPIVGGSADGPVAASFHAEPELKDAVASSSSGKCPDGMAAVGSSCVDRYEAGLVEVTGAGDAPWSPYQVPDPGKTYKAVSRAGQVPQGYISGDEAKRACAAAGKRLCRVDEWEKACMGPAKTTYPYGNDYQSGVCNEHDTDWGYSSPILRVFPGFGFNDAGKMNDPRINQQADGLLPSGAKQGCTNGYGVYDMVGNLHEWIDGPKSAFRGGYYVDTRINGRGCHYQTTAHPTSYHDYSTGFRCCADPS